MKNINFRFVGVIFARYLIVFIIGSIFMALFSFLIGMPSSYGIPMSVAISSFFSAFAFILTFSALPYYDCNNKIHWIYLDENEIRCKKCDFHKKAKLKYYERAVITNWDSSDE